MSVPDQEKLGIKHNGKLNTISVMPIKKRPLILDRSPSPPSETQCLPTVYCDTTQDKTFSLLQAQSSEASDIPICLTALSKEGSSVESKFKISDNRDISEAPKHEDPIEHESNETLQSMASIIVEDQNGLKVNVSDEKLISLKGIEQPSTLIVGHFNVPIKKEILDAENISSQTSTSQLSGNTELQSKESFEKLNISEPDTELLDRKSRKETTVNDSLLKCSTFGPNTDSGQRRTYRLNWDLNMAMDTWEESVNESALSHEGDRSCVGGLLGRGPQTNLILATTTNQKPIASPPMINEPKCLTGDHLLSLLKSESEASLDLRLKPSFNSESDFTRGIPFPSGNVDSLKETQFLSLSTMSSSSLTDTKFSVCGERKTELSESKTFLLKPIKSEPCEIGEISNIAISEIVSSTSDLAIKQEPLEGKSQDCVIAKKIGLSHMNADDYNLHESVKTPLVAVGTGLMASITKSDSFIKDVFMNIPAEVDDTAHVMQSEILSNDKICHKTMLAAASSLQYEKGIFCEHKSLDMKPLVNEVWESISTKQANESSEQADLFIKCQIEDQIMNLVSEACEQSHMAEESPCELLNSGISPERVVDEMVEIESHTSISETDSKSATVVVGDCDVLEVNQVTSKSICMIEEQGENECKIGSSHVVHEKGVIDDVVFEVEVKDRALISPDVDSVIRVELNNNEGVHPRGLVDVPIAFSPSHELVKHTILESFEMSKDPGTVESANFDPATAADLQESSSVTGDSNRTKTSKIIRKTSRDVLKKDKISEQKTKFDIDSTLRVVSIENQALMDKVGGCTKSSVSISASEVIKSAFDRGRTGRIINLNSASSQRMKPVHEMTISSRLRRENPADKFFNRENSHSRHSRDENPGVQSRKTENEKKRGFAYGNLESGSTLARARDGSDYSRLRFRDKQRPNRFGDTNCDPNHMQEQINDHNDFRYSRAINSAAASVASGSDTSVPCADRISKKATNEFRSRANIARRRHSSGSPKQLRIMHPHTNEVNSSRRMQRNAHDRLHVSHEKMNRPEPGEFLDPLRGHRHSQFERTDHIAPRRERRSLSPVCHRAPSQLRSPSCSPRSQAMSPSHWSSRTASDSEGFNEPEMVQCRAGTPNIMQESIRSTRRHYAEEVLVRRRGSAYGARVHDAMMEDISTREHDFQRSRREFPRKLRRLGPSHQNRSSGEYYRAPFARAQIHELPVDSDYDVGRRRNETHAPARYRQHFPSDNDIENFSFHAEERPLRTYKYQAEGNQGFHEGRNSREFDRRFKHQFGNTSRSYRHIEEQQHEDGFRRPEGQGWNDSGFNNIRSKRRRY